MKIIISSSGDSLDSPIDVRFGRCPYFLIVDTETMEFEAVENTNANSPKGAGIGAAQLAIDKGVEAVLTGRCGPNAYKVLQTAGIKVHSDISGTVRQSVEQFSTGLLTRLDKPNSTGRTDTPSAQPAPAGSVNSFGMGRRQGGNGHGMGRGRGGNGCGFNWKQGANAHGRSGKRKGQMACQRAFEGR